ncbi:hypothetical protein IW261DRAFT_1426347 [Armillaria novae-zelandiae]|uniref:Uncharacterized protein n=1 Tax=Armillaria novae-zelandiae TaxID=153914 RepID=A0AA39NMR9_9AGAR|nr:hypothetical protein IW261DRAFT_1426347 [Armillaria novae-zelandiae]
MCHKSFFLHSDVDDSLRRGRLQDTDVGLTAKPVLLSRLCAGGFATPSLQQFLGVVIAVLLHNLTHTSSTPEIHSPLLPGFFDALSCANHSRNHGHRGFRKASPSHILCWTSARMIASMFEFIQLNPTGPLYNSFLYAISFIVDRIEIVIRRNDFMMGDAVPGEFSPSMLMALGGWNVLVMDARVALERSSNPHSIITGLKPWPVEAFQDQALAPWGRIEARASWLTKDHGAYSKEGHFKDFSVHRRGDVEFAREGGEGQAGHNCRWIGIIDCDNSGVFLIKNTRFADPSKRNIRIKCFLEVSAYQAFVDCHRRGNGWQGRKKVLHTNISQLESGLVYWDGRIEIHFYGLRCQRLIANFKI